jgi:hypothetical protein
MSSATHSRLDLFSRSAQQIFLLAEVYAGSYKHRTIGPQHLFLGCFTQSSLAYEFTTSLGFELNKTAIQLMSVYPDHTTGVVQPKLSQSMEATITLAIAEARRLGHTQITTAHLLIAMLIRYETWLRNLLKPVALSSRVLIALLQQALLTTHDTADDPLPTQAERERLQFQKQADTSSVVPDTFERFIRQLRGAIGLPPLKPRIAFTMIDYLAATIDILPNCAVLYTYRANQLIQRKKYLDAAIDCSQALNLRPDFAGAYLHRAVAYQEAGDFERSLND